MYIYVYYIQSIYTLTIEHNFFTQGWIYVLKRALYFSY